jgi:hypothetical protein
MNHLDKTFQLSHSADHHAQQPCVFKDGAFVFYIKSDYFYANYLNTKNFKCICVKYKISKNQKSKVCTRIKKFIHTIHIHSVHSDNNI